MPPSVNFLEFVVVPFKLLDTGAEAAHICFPLAITLSISAGRSRLNAGVVVATIRIIPIVRILI
jgi:hypothetical protein